MVTLLNFVWSSRASRLTKSRDNTHKTLDDLFENLLHMQIFLSESRKGRCLQEYAIQHAPYMPVEYVRHIESDFSISKPKHRDV